MVEGKRVAVVVPAFAEELLVAAKIAVNGSATAAEVAATIDAAEAAIREHYTDALCVVGASHSAVELSAIVEQLQSLSSVQILSTATYVDASGEWIEAGVIAPDPERQSAFDEEFGPGVVRMIPLLAPMTSA